MRYPQTCTTRNSPTGDHSSRHRALATLRIKRSVLIHGITPNTIATLEASARGIATGNNSNLPATNNLFLANLHRYTLHYGRGVSPGTRMVLRDVYSYPTTNILLLISKTRRTLVTHVLQLLRSTNHPRLAEKEERMSQRLTAPSRATLYFEVQIKFWEVDKSMGDPEILRYIPLT